MTYPVIHVRRPYKERALIYGMIQSGKSNCLAWLLKAYSIRGVHWKLFDTLGQHNWEYDPDIGEIIKPRFKEKLEMFEDVCIEIWKQGNLVFAIEEVDQYCTPQNLPSHLDTLVNMGANRNIGLIFITRRLAEVHNTIVGNCEHHFIFRAYLPRDIEYYRKFVGHIVDYAKDLEPFHFIYYKVGEKPIFYKPLPKIL